MEKRDFRNYQQGQEKEKDKTLSFIQRIVEGVLKKRIMVYYRWKFGKPKREGGKEH